MKLHSRRVWVLAAVALAVVFAGGAALAASGSGSASPSSFLDSVAQHLGISTKKLEDATKAAAIDQVDAALKEGRITQAQADALKARIEAGGAPFFGGPMLGFGLGHRGHGPFGPDHGDRLSAAAAYLGLTEAELHAKLEAGQSLAQIAKAQGKSVDGLENAILSDARKRLDKAVSDGLLTQAQANDLYARLQARIDDMVNRTDDGMHEHFGFRHFGGPPPAFRPGSFGGPPAAFDNPST